MTLNCYNGQTKSLRIRLHTYPTLKCLVHRHNSTNTYIETRIQSNTLLQSLKVQAGHNKLITLVNIYIPPQNSTASKLPVPIPGADNFKRVIVGSNFNAKHKSLYSHRSVDNRGLKIGTQVTRFTYTLTHNSTSLTKQTDNSPPLGGNTTWRTETGTSSDNKPIIITTQNLAISGSTHNNYKRAD